MDTNEELCPATLSGFLYKTSSAFSIALRDTVRRLSLAERRRHCVRCGRTVATVFPICRYPIEPVARETARKRLHRNSLAHGYRERSAVAIFTLPPRFLPNGPTIDVFTQRAASSDADVTAERRTDRDGLSVPPFYAP